MYIVHSAGAITSKASACNGCWTSDITDGTGVTMVDNSSLAIVCVLILVLLGLPLLARGGRGSHCSGRTSNPGMGGEGREGSY